MAGGLACWSASVRGTRMRWTVLRRYTAGNGKPPSIPRPAAPRSEATTDHNHGVVMAGAVDLDVIAVVSKNTDDVVRVKSKGFDGRDEVKLEQLSPVLAEQGRSAALIRGVAAGIAKQGGVLGGFDAYTTSDVLRGSGLSSSAAFEVVIGTVFNGEYNQGRFSAVDIAKISQYAENEYFGKPSGLMDQTACSVGSVITIDFRDPASPVVEKSGF